MATETTMYDMQVRYIPCSFHILHTLENFKERICRNVHRLACVGRIPMTEPSCQVLAGFSLMFFVCLVEPDIFGVIFLLYGLRK